MSEMTLREAASALGMSPLQVLVQCALRGIPCPEAVLDDALLPVVGGLQAPPPPPDLPLAEEESESDETDQDRRLRIVRRILEKLSTMGKFWPARTERRSTARGLAGSDVGLALNAVEVLHDCGLLVQEAHGGHEPRVGLQGDRRREIADIVAGQPIPDDQLRAWIEQR
jgi:hypothetical protein